MNKPILFCTLFILNSVLAFAQAPNISYGGGAKVFALNKQITTLTPQNTGGVIPATTYGEIATFAGTSVNGTADGPAAQANFTNPASIAVDKLGNFYVSDMGNNVIRKISADGIVSTVAGNYNGGDTDGQGTASSLNNPCGIAVDAAGNVFFADRFNNKIKKISTTGMVTTLAGTGYSGSNDGTGIAAQFNSPFGVSIDRSGNIYVTEQLNNDVRKITPSGVVTTLSGAGANAGFFYPTGSVMDVAGNLYIADNLNNQIKKLATGGNLTTYAGAAAGFANGAALQAQFNQATDVTIDDLGNLFVADQKNNSVRKITPDGVVSTLAVDNPVSSATVNLPKGLVYFAGKVYVTSYETNTIKSVSTTGFAIDKILPAGLTFDSKTGIIAGMPTALSSAADYTITAYNTFGVSKTVINIQVAEVLSNNFVLSGISLNPSSQLINTGMPWAYTMPVINTTNSVLLTPTAQESHATIQVNGLAVASGTASQPIVLSGDSTLIPILVTAQDGVSKQTYNITIVKVAGSNNAVLSGITLDPTSALVSTGTPWSYSFSVPNNTGAARLTAVAQDSHATININGVNTLSGAPSDPIMLTGDVTPATIEVTAEDGVTKHTYNLSIIRTALSNNAGLSGIACNPASSLNLTSPYNYSLPVPSGTASIKLTPTSQESHATITVNGVAVQSGSASGDITLTGNSTPVTIVVTAENGITLQTYKLTIIKTAGSNNAGLSNIKLNPAAPLVYVAPWTYTMQVPPGTVSATLIPFAQESHAVIKVNGVVVASGAESAPITLTGVNTLASILVMAQDGIGTQTYYVTIARAADALSVVPNTILKFRDDGVNTSLGQTDVLVHQALSPNGDGINDVLQIEGIDTRPDNRVTIMSRDGSIVYDVKGYNNSSIVFDGRAGNGKMQQPGTYFYTLEYKQGTEIKRKTGYIVIKY